MCRSRSVSVRSPKSPDRAKISRGKSKCPLSDPQIVLEHEGYVRTGTLSHERMSRPSFSKSFSNGEVDRILFPVLCYVSRVTISEDETRNDAPKYVKGDLVSSASRLARGSVIIRISSIPISTV